MGLFILFLLFLSVQADVLALPSNLTTDYQSASNNFRIDGSPLNATRVDPLTTSLREKTDTQLQSFNISGTATQVIPGNSLDLKGSEIALVSCDPNDYTGNIGVDETIEYVTSAQPSAAAVLLYSKSATHCNLTIDDTTAARYPNLFTLNSRRAYSALQATLKESDPFFSIVSMSLSTSNVPTDASGGTGGSGDSPNTAMIILYSITGIITALFLGIIITGAVRAHRHPERYGPRRIAGRVRQSRARGIARAMLETIPIVKYDDKHDDVEAAKRDVEMSREDPAREDSPSGDGITEPTTPVSDAPTPDGQEGPTPTAPEAKTETVPDAGNFSCPICTDDFIKGQDLRVLPCNHQFHMECIDPWLVNVSGTCPLCRIDLNPPQAETTEQTEENANAETTETPEPTDPTPETQPQTQPQTQTRPRRLTNYLHGPLNAHRMHNATVEERLATLRRIREANQTSTEERPRLTTRLRERFRIRTRAHDPEASAVAQSTPAPAAPAPVHMPPSTA